MLEKEENNNIGGIGGGGEQQHEDAGAGGEQQYRGILEMEERSSRGGCWKQREEKSRGILEEMNRNKGWDAETGGQAQCGASC